MNYMEDTKMESKKKLKISLTTHLCLMEITATVMRYMSCIRMRTREALT